MERKLKLARLILTEAECLKQTQDVDSTIAVAEELTKDAIELAKLVEYENKELCMKTLLIDDMRTKDVDIICRTYDEGIEALMTQGPFSVLLLDHDLGDTDERKTGYGIMCWLEANPQYIPGHIQFVTANPVGRENMRVVRSRLYPKTEFLDRSK